jgi:rhodanese-related sulfurtransferase
MIQYRYSTCLNILFACLALSFANFASAQPVDNNSVASNNNKLITDPKSISFQEYVAKHGDDVLAPYVSATTLNQRIVNGERIIILDARTEKEYNVSRIKNARRVGFDDFSSERIWMLKRTAPIVVYCTSNERSNVVADYLLEIGFKDVSILHLAIIGWSNAGLPLYDRKNIKTNYVHVGKKDNNNLLKKGRPVW